MKVYFINTLAIGLVLGILAFLAPQRAEAQHLDFSGGFLDPTSMTLNGGDSGASILPDGKLQLSDGKLDRRGSAFSKTRVDVDVFHAKFRFQLTKGIENDWGPMADGITITFHNSPNGPYAIGPAGGGLAYGRDYKWMNGLPDMPGISSSVAVKFDTHNNDGEVADYSGYGDNLFGDGPGFRFPLWWQVHLSNSTGLYTNGETPTHYPELGRPAYDLTVDGIDFHSGRAFEAELLYDGVHLTVTIRDMETGATSTQSYTVNIPAIVGGTSAYVGFTGSTGWFTAFQDILNLSVNKLSPADLCELVHRFSTSEGVAHSLCAKLEAIAEARSEQSKAGIVNAFILEVQAQSNKAISPGNAAILIKLAQAL